MSVATFARSRGSVARTTGWLGKPAARAQDWCVFDFTSRFMNGFVTRRRRASYFLSLDDEMKLMTASI
jgi:hypothetical protein